MFSAALRGHPARRRPIPRGWREAVIVCVLLAILAACGGGGSDGASSDDTSGGDNAAPEPQQGGKVVLGIAEHPEGFDPSLNRISYSALSVFKALYDPIAVVNDDGEAVPYLVESIEPNEDFTEWTITMRDGIKFHNGDPLTPQILATHLKTMQLSPLTVFTFKPINAVAVVDEAARPQHEAGEISDEDYDVMRRQVLVYMSEPWSTFPAFLATYQTGFVAHPDYLAGELPVPTGTGPFVYEEDVQDDHVTLSRNPNYWREGLPYLDEVEFRTLTDPAARYHALEAGDIDMMISNAPSQMVDFGENGVADGQQLYEDRSQGDEQLLLLNTQSGPTADRDVRHALQLATDAGALNNGLYDDHFDLADTPFSSESFWYSDPGSPDPNGDAAKQAVEAWEADNGPLTVKISTYDNTDALRLAQAIQEQWKNVGIDAQVEALDDSAMITAITMGQYDVALNQFLNGEDPDLFYPFWDPNPDNIGGPGEFSINFTRYTSPTQQDALAAGRRTADPAERKTEYAKLWQDWGENAPYIFLWHSQQVLVAVDGIQGLDSFDTPDGEPATELVSGSVFLTEVWRS
jgi:ABC-type transport system substrate-binding protein